MENQIPLIIDELYSYFVTEPDPKFWPDYLRGDPVRAHGLWSFYQGSGWDFSCPARAWRPCEPPAVPWPETRSHRAAFPAVRGPRFRLSEGRVSGRQRAAFPAVRGPHFRPLVT